MQNNKIALKSTSTAALTIATMLSGSTMAISACETTGIPEFTPISESAISLNKNVLIIDQNVDMNWVKEQLNTQGHTIESIILHGDETTLTADFFTQNGIDTSLIRSVYVAPENKANLTALSFKLVIGEEHQVGNFIKNSLKKQVIVKANPRDIIVMGPVKSSIIESLVNNGHNVMIGTSRFINTPDNTLGLTQERVITLLDEVTEKPLILTFDQEVKGKYALDNALDHLYETVGTEGLGEIAVLFGNDIDFSVERYREITARPVICFNVDDHEVITETGIELSEQLSLFAEDLKSLV